MFHTKIVVFPGSAKGEDETKKYEPNPEKHREYIFGIHVANYMRKLKEEDSEVFGRQFKQYVAASIGPDDIEGAYKKVHAEIRKDPVKKRGSLELGHFKTRKEPKKEGATYPKKHHTRQKVSNAQRKSRIHQKLTARLKKEAGGGASQA